MSERAWVNGSVVPAGEAALPATARGALYGLGLFETMPTFAGEPFLLDRHWARMRSSCGELGLREPPGEEEARRAIAELVRANERPDGVVRLTWYPEDRILVGTSRAFSPPEGGVKAVVYPERIGADSVLARHKTCCYWPYLRARAYAREKGAYEAIMVDARGRLTEGAMTNLFLVRDGTLLTPSAEGPLLRGITRAVVMELARKQGIAVEEAGLVPEELLAADEAFLTNSAVGLVPLVELDGDEIGAGAEGKTVRRLREAYSHVLIAGTRKRENEPET